MDPFTLLSRLTRFAKSASSRQQHITPSSGETAQPRLFPAGDRDKSHITNGSRKRKRPQKESHESTELDFFGDGSHKVARTASNKSASREDGSHDGISDEDETVHEHPAGKPQTWSDRAVEMPEDERKELLQRHKLKATWIKAASSKEVRRDGVDKKGKLGKTEKLPVYPRPLQSFAELTSHYGLPSRLASNIEDQGYTAPTEVQMAALPLSLDWSNGYLPTGKFSVADFPQGKIDLLTVAPTGSGKTLAFMIPLIHDIGKARQNATRDARRKTSAVILAPTKELASQISNEGRKLAQGTGIRITLVRKGMKLAMQEVDQQTGQVEAQGGIETVVKSDILVATPGILAAAIKEACEVDSAVLSDIRQLVLDEADVLLDPLFRDQTLSVWNGLPQESMHVSLWSATMGSNIEELARSTIETRLKRLSQESNSDLVAAPLVRLVVGLKDSAVPNVQHRLVYAASEQGKLMGLRQLLHPAATSKTGGPPLLPPFLVFTQTIERAVALHSELVYDIPAEAGGISRIAVLHSDLSDTARDDVMTGFRKGEIWILITTDLLSRGVDFRGVNGVVNYDIPTSSAAYVHRVGRTGRAGREGGVAVTLYSKEDIPYLKPIANLVATAHKLKRIQDSDPAEGVQPWLLDALPTLSKKAKQDLKKRGVESRTTRGAQKDLKAARKSRISTKPGYLRREENKKKGAIAGSRNRQETILSNANDESDFDGFD